MGFWNTSKTMKTKVRKPGQLFQYITNYKHKGESHPLYEEFGSIILLTLAFRHHFTLQESDLGIGTSDSFLRTYFQNARTSRRPSELTETERQTLGGWIKGLFETNAISDELMSTCTPREFYLLIPTLFDQSLKAFQTGLLALDTVKSGLECRFLHGVSCGKL